jgi:pentatricopeptide repeat protein
MASDTAFCPAACIFGVHGPSDILSSEVLTSSSGQIRAFSSRRGRPRSVLRLSSSSPTPSTPIASPSLPRSSALPVQLKSHPTRRSWPERRAAAKRAIARGGTELTAAFNDWLGAIRAQGKGLRDALPVLDRMAETNSSFDEVTYTHLIAMCARDCDASAASELLENMREKGMRISLVTYATFLATCARSNDSIRAKEAWGRMVSEGLRPNTRACGAYIDCLSRAGFVDDVVEVMRMYPIGDTLVSRTSLVSGLARAGRADDALRALHEMRKSGFTPNVLAYTAVTHALGKARRAPEAIDVLNDAVSRGVEADALLYESVICACAAVGDLRNSLNVLRAMQSARLELSDRGFEGLIYACGSSGQFRRAYVIFQAASEAGKASGRVISAIASALLRAGRVDEMTVQVMKEMAAFSAGKTDAEMTRLGVNPQRFRKKFADVKRIRSARSEKDAEI